MKPSNPAQASSTAEATPFDDGTLNDLFFERLDLGLDFYLGLGPAAGVPVFDVACGTGRIMLPCLKAGVDVEGLELFPNMLAQLAAQRKIASVGPFSCLVQHRRDRDRTSLRRYCELRASQSGSRRLPLLLGLSFLFLASRAPAAVRPWEGIGAPVPAVTVSVPGSLDYTFDPTANGTLVGLVGSLPIVQTVLEQPDGKVLIGGSFNGVNGAPRRNLARLNADGSLDASFQTGLGPDGGVSDMALQPDGKLVMIGGFRTVNTQSSAWIARLNADGSVDAAG